MGSESHILEQIFINTDNNNIHIDFFHLHLGEQ